MQHQGKKKKEKKEIFEPQTSTPRQLPKMISTAFRGSVQRARPFAVPSLRRCISSNHQVFEGEFQSSPSSEPANE